MLNQLKSGAWVRSGPGKWRLKSRLITIIGDITKVKYELVVRLAQPSNNRLTTTSTVILVHPGSY